MGPDYRRSQPIERPTKSKGLGNLYSGPAIPNKQQQATQVVSMGVDLCFNLNKTK